VLLVVPLMILSNQEKKALHLLTVSVCIVVFSLLVSMASKASNLETMAAVAVYAVVLVMFAGSVPTPT
jgi:chromate transport protein ChrA